MEEIILKNIEINKNILKYTFSVSEGYKEFFSDEPFVIEYPENIESVPEAVLAVPFVTNIIPLIWLTNGTLRLNALDEDFYNCLINVKKGYQAMFPESTFTGNIEVNNVIPCNKQASGSVALFSGGLDATQTLISHLDEKPDLVYIWGSDIDFDNPDGMKKVQKSIGETADKYNLAFNVIRSSFRDFDNEAALSASFSKQLKDSWWHGIKHGMAILGHIAPYTYLKSLKTVYIASSFCPADGKVRCASDPSIDNHLRFCGAGVIHDGFEFSRQDKIHNVVSFVEKTGNTFPIHVCWETQSGDNCCSCEKCYRTIAGILAEGANPSKYGFKDFEKSIRYMQGFIISTSKDNITFTTQWPRIQEKIIQNKNNLQKLPYWKHIKWLEKTDFAHPEKVKIPYSFRLRSHLADFKFYNTLHKVKNKLLK